MTAQEQIAKLESLLERIRRNAGKPRMVAAAPVRVETPAVAKAPEPKPARVVPEPPPAPEPVVVAKASSVEDVSLEALGATEASASAVEAPRDKVQSADMEELEIVEIGSDVVEIAESAAADEVPALEEPVPESAPRPAAQSVEVELEAPIKTPPPESGRQAVTPPPPIPEPRVPAVASDDDFDEDDLLEADLSGGPISIVTPGSPTTSQLGQTVHIDAAPEPRAEIPLAPVPAPAAPASSRRVDPLATTVPDMRTALGFAKTVPDVQSPFAEAVRATTEARAEAPAPRPSAPELVVERPPIDVAHAAQVITSKAVKMPETFLELLDASLGLHI